MSISGIDTSSTWFQVQSKDKSRQNMPGTMFPPAPSDGKAASASTPVAGLTSSSATTTPAPTIVAAPDASEANDPVKEFTDYMKQTPAERMQYAWLKQHGISKSEFDAMSGAEKQKLIDEMKHELEEKMKDQAKASKTDILV